MSALRLALIAGLALAGGPALADDLADEVIGYMDFATYDAGIIVPEQLTQDVFEAVLFVDTRDAEQFAQGTIPGAIHMEWRSVPGRLDELPVDQKVVMFCNTGSLSAQAVFAARLLGHENVVVLQTGIDGWHKTGAYHPG